jgi:VWFA-related protein
MHAFRRRPRRDPLLYVLLGILAAGGALGAQSPATPPAAGTAPAPTPAATFISRETVVVTNVDVIVEDSKGNRVSGLKRDDFIVIEDGLDQPVTNFFAVEQGRMAVVGDEEVPSPPAPGPVPGSPPAPAPAAAAAPKTKIVIFVDNLSLTPFNRNRVLRNVEEWVRDAVKGNVEGMILAWNRSLKVRRKFTNDGRDLSDVLKQIEEESGSGVTRNSSFRDAIQRIDDTKSADQAIQVARSYAQEQGNDLAFTLEALKGSIDQLAGVEGRKIFIHVSEGLPQSPGMELWRYIQDKYHDMSSTMMQFEFDKTSFYIGLVRSANAANVSLYMFDASGLSADINVSAENRYQSTRIDTFTQRLNMQGMLQLMAEETGGLAVLNRNVVTPDLKQIEKDYTSYYSLGYRSLRAGSDRPHKLEVKLKKKGFNVRARRSFVEKGLETRTIEAVQAGLYFSRDENPLAAGLEVGRATPSSSGYFQVPIRIRIPYTRLAMLPEGAKVRGRLMFYFLVMDSLEKKSDLSTQSKIVEMDAKRFQEVQKKDFIFDVTLLMIPGRQRLSFAVRDEVTAQASYLQKDLFVSVFSGEEPKPK